LYSREPISTLSHPKPDSGCREYGNAGSKSPSVRKAVLTPIGE
jgi:hypothetical protein